MSCVLFSLLRMGANSRSKRSEPGRTVVGTLHHFIDIERDVRITADENVVLHVVVDALIPIVALKRVQHGVDHVAVVVQHRIFRRGRRAQMGFLRR